MIFSVLMSNKNDSHNKVIYPIPDSHGTTFSFAVNSASSCKISENFTDLQCMFASFTPGF